MSLPQQQKQRPNHKRQQPNRPVFCLDKHLPQAVHKGGDPEEPFEEGRDHDHADDGRVDNLDQKRYPSVSMMRNTAERGARHRHTSFTGHGSAGSTSSSILGDWEWSSNKKPAAQNGRCLDPTAAANKVWAQRAQTRDLSKRRRENGKDRRGGWKGGKGGGGYAFKKPRNIKTEKRKRNREAGSSRRRQAKGPGTGTPMDFLRRPLRGWWRAVKRRTAAAARARKRIDRSRPLARSPRPTAACRQVPGRVRRWRQIPTVYFSQVVTERRVGRAVPPI